MNISQKNLAKLLEYMATHIRYKERYDRELCRPLEDMKREKIDSNLNIQMKWRKEKLLSCKTILCIKNKIPEIYAEDLFLIGYLLISTIVVIYLMIEAWKEN